MKITAIMRTKNAESTIKEVLESLFSQKNVAFDLLIIDSSSKDKTIEIAKSYPAHITSIPEDQYFPGKVLNATLATLSCDLVVFLNSDCTLLSSDSLENLLAPFSSPFVQATFARQIPRDNARSWVKRDYAAAFPEKRDAPPWQPYSLCFAAMRYKAWQERPFYTLSWGSEDAEWGTWARKQGYIVQYVSNSLVMHSHNYTLRQLYGRRFIEGEADAFILAKAYSWMHFFWDWTKSTMRDLLYYLRHGDLLHLYEIPAVRLVYYWAYFKGNRWGHERMKKNNTDTTIGQTTVLSRYDD